MRARLSLAILVFLAPWYARALAEPVIFWASDPVAAGETVLATGRGIDRNPRVEVLKLDNGPDASTNPAPPADAKVVQATPNSLKFTLPDQLADGVYRVVIQTDEGSTSLLINAPTVYWQQGDQDTHATPGGWVRVLGRNIGRSPDASLRLTPKAGGAPISLRAAKFDLWDATFDVPASTATGEYDAVLWNGNGDSSSVVQVGPVTIAAPAAGPGRSQNLLPLAQGDDSTARINQALADIGQSGGGTVILGPGTFTVSGTLVVPPNTTLAGASEDSTILSLTDSDKPPRVLIAGTSDFAVRDLSIFARRHAHLIVGGYAPDGPIPDAKNIAIERVRIRASMYMGHLSAHEVAARLATALTFSSGGPDAIRMSGQNISILDSDILSSGRSLVLNGVSGAHIKGNNFYNGRYGWYSISVSERILFEENQIIGADLQSTGGGINTMSNTTPLRSQNIIFTGNRFLRFYGWDRESMTSDGPGGCFAGKVAFTANDTHVSLATNLTHAKRAPDNAGCVGAALTVMGGAGAGEVATVVSANDGTMTLDRPWRVGSDADTVAVISPTQKNYLIVHNYFEDAGSLQIFGSGINHVFAHNRFVRSSGITIWALDYSGIQSIMYMQVLDNEVQSPPLFGFSGLRVKASHVKEFPSALVRGVVLRRNRLFMASSIVVQGEGEHGAPSVADVLIEKNQIANTNLAISIGRRVDAAVAIGNTFERNRQDIDDQSNPNARSN